MSNVKGTGVSKLAETPFIEQGWLPQSSAPRRRRLAAAITGVFSTISVPIIAEVVSSTQAQLGLGAPTNIEVAAQSIADAVDLSAMEQIAPIVVELITDAFIEGGESQILRLRVETNSIVNQLHDSALEYARERSAEMVGMSFDEVGNLVPNANAEMTITTSTRNKIRDIIVRALSPQEGETALNIKNAIEQLTDDLSGSRLFSGERAALIAQAEIGMAHNAGSMVALQSAANIGVEVGKKWSTSGKPTVCSEVCKLNEEAGVIPLDRPFPSGHQRPLGHPKCECALTGAPLDPQQAARAA
jgi:hypothetical protein